NVRRFVTPKAEIDLGLHRYNDPKKTEASARLNWDAGFANISPGVTYNSDNDLVATLNTRFGVLRDPGAGEMRMFDRHVTANGGVSAFVYLDKDGDNVFNKDADEVIEGAIIQAPQNGGRQETNEEGYAFFKNMGQMRLTDV